MLAMKDLKNLERDDLLQLIGLQTRRTASDWVLPLAGLFGVGLLVGAGVGLLLAPTTGKQLRHDLREQFQSGAKELAKALPVNGPAPRAGA